MKQPASANADIAAARAGCVTGPNFELDHVVLSHHTLLAHDQTPAPVANLNINLSGFRTHTTIKHERMTERVDMFNRWVERFVRVGDAAVPLYDTKRGDAGLDPSKYDAVKKVGEQVAIRGIAPVFGKFTSSGEVQHYSHTAPNEVKNHHFIWAAFADYSAGKLDDASGLVPEAFFKDTASTLALIRPLLKQHPAGNPGH